MFGEVDLITTPFDVKYAAVLQKFTVLGGAAEGAAAGTGSLDKSMTGLGVSSSEAAAGLTRADMALRETSVLASRAAVSTSEADLAQSRYVQSSLRAAAAVQRVADVQASAEIIARRLTAAEAQLAEMQAAEGVSADKLAAAQERVNLLRAASVRATGRAAAAQASLIAANDRVALSQERVAESTMLGARSADRMRSAWAAVPAPVKAGGVATAVGIGFAIRAAARFDSEMANVESLADTTPQAMAQLREAALTVGQAYGYTADQVAQGEAELIKAGVSVQQIIGGALTGSLTLAAAGQMDLAQASEIAAFAVKQFNLEGSDVPHVADLLAAGAGKALGSVADLGEGLKYGGLAAAQAGYSIDETVGVLAQLAQSAQVGSMGGTQLAMMLRNLQKPSHEATEEFGGFLEKIRASDGSMKSWSQIAGLLHDKIGRLPKAQQDAALATLFTSRAVRAATVLMHAGAAETQKWIDKTHDQAYATEQAAGKLDSLSGDWRKFVAVLTSAMITLGEHGQDPLRGLLQGLTTGIGEAQDLVEALGENALVVGTLHDVASAVGHIVAAVGDGADAAEPFVRLLLMVGGGAVLVALRAVAEVTDDVAAGVEAVTGFFADNEIAAYALAGVLSAALVPAVIDGVTWLGRMVAVNAAAAMIAIRAAVAQAAAAFVAAGRGAAGFGAAMTALELNPVGLGLAVLGAAVGAVTFAFMHGDDAAKKARESVDNYVQSLHINYNSAKSVALAEADLNARLQERLDLVRKNALESQKSTGRSGDLGYDIPALQRADATVQALRDQLDELHETQAKTVATTGQLSRTLGVNSDAVYKAANAVGVDLKDGYAAALPKVAGYIEAAQRSHDPTKQAAFDMRQLGGEANTAADDIGLLDDAWNQLIGNFTGAKAAIASAKDSIHDLRKALNDSGGSLRLNSAEGRAAAEQLDRTSKAVQTAIEAIFRKHGHFTDQGVKQVHHLVDAMTAGLPKGTAAYRKLRDGVESFMEQLEDSAPEHGKRTGQGYANGVGSKATAARRAAGQIGNAAKAALTEPGAGASEGLALAQGFAAGMQSDNAFVAIASAAGALITAAVNALHHHGEGGSPYRRFIPEGRFLAQGFALGMDAGGRDIDRAAGRMVRRAHDAVAAAVAAAVRPEITDPDRLAAILGRREGSAADAVVAERRAREAYRRLREHAKALDDDAKAADRAAQKASRHAEAMKGESAAEKAAKDQAEAHAKVLTKRAHEADRAARQADRAAELSKRAWDKTADAADNATRRAVEDAQQLVSVLEQQFDDMSRMVDDFTGQIRQGVTGDGSIASIWQELTDAQQQAADALADAQDAVNNAEGGAATAEQMQALADAQQALAAANQNLSAAGVQSGVDVIIGNAQQFASDLQALIAQGATGPLSQQIVAMGPQAGDAFAKSLLSAGASSVTRLSSSLDQIADIAAQAADSMAATFYGGGVTAMEQFILGIEEQFPELTAALEPILRKLYGLFGDVPAQVADDLMAVGGVAAWRGGPVRGGDGAALVAVLHPDDRKLLAEAAMRPVQLLVDRNGQRVIGEVANDHRQERRLYGDPAYK